MERHEYEWRNRMFNSIEKLFDGQDKIKQDVTAIRLKMAEDDHAGKLADITAKGDKRDERIASLEKFRTQAIAVGLTLNFLLGVALALVAIFKK